MFSFLPVFILSDPLGLCSYRVPAMPIPSSVTVPLLSSHILCYLAPVFVSLFRFPFSVTAVLHSFPILCFFILPSFPILSNLAPAPRRWIPSLPLSGGKITAVFPGLTWWITSFPYLGTPTSVYLSLQVGPRYSGGLFPCFIPLFVSEFQHSLTLRFCRGTHTQQRTP